MSYTLEIVSRHGVELEATGVERVVVRRREREHFPGSEVAICRNHAPMLMQVQPCRVRWYVDGQPHAFEVPGGVLEVWGDRVTVAMT